MALSAFSPQDGLRLRQCIYDYFQTQFEEARLVISPLDAGSLSLVYTSCVIMKADYNEDGHNEFLVKAPAHTLAKLEHVKVVS
jgi:hypothetical protein